MARFDVVSIGGALKDHTFITNEGKLFHTPDDLTAQKMLAFEYGAKIRTREAYLNLGGGAANSSVALSRLGLKTAAIFRIGKDEVGDHVIAQLKKEKVNTQYAQVDREHLTGFSFIVMGDRKDKDRVVFTYSGCGQLLSFDPKKLSRLKTDWFYLTSLSGTSWQKNLKAIFAFADKKGIKVHWNMGGKQIQAGKKALQQYLKQTEILQLNKDEAIELVLSGMKLGKKNPNHLNRPLYLLNILYEWGPRIVVITDGKKGSWIFDGETVYRQKVKKSKVVDTTGVGDGFGSSFLAGIINEKGDIDEALKWASVNSSSVATKIGAQNGLLTKKEILRKLRRRR